MLVFHILRKKDTFLKRYLLKNNVKISNDYGVIMPKSTKESKKTDTLCVINILEKDAKKSIDEISKKCGFSRQKVWRIITELEKEKLIWGYTAVVDELVKKKKHFTVLVKKNPAAINNELLQEIIHKKIDDQYADLVTIENIYYTHGICDYVLTFYAADIYSAKKFTQALFNRLNYYVKEFTIIETLFPVRKQGMKNPRIKQLAEYIT